MTQSFCINIYGENTQPPSEVKLSDIKINNELQNEKCIL